MLQISIVIPTHNRREMLRACLESLADQTAPADTFEVIVVVDGSTDGTGELLRELETPFALRVLDQPQSGQTIARNAGVRLTRAPALLFLDDDMIASPALVAAHIRAQRETPGAGIGHLERKIAPNADRLARLRAESWAKHYDLLADKSPTFRDCYSGNLSLPRADFDATGGFAEDLVFHSVDVEFAFRLRERGVQFVYVRDAVAAEDNADDWRAILRYAEQAGEISSELYRRHPAILPELEIGGRDYLSGYWSGLRAVILALRVPPIALGAVGLLLPRSWARQWLVLALTCAYWTGVRRAVDRDTWRRLTKGVLILMYHAVGAEGEAPTRFLAPRRRFARHMRWLAWSRSTVISLEEFVECRRNHRLPPPKSVVLTFDDGYVDNRELVLPILEKHGFPATFYIVTRGGSANTWDPPGTGLADRPLLGLAEAAKLQQSGLVSLGGHTRSHPRLTELGPDELVDELAGCAADMEAATGIAPRTFAYPYGRESPEVRQAVADAGFHGACGVLPGRNRPAAPLFALYRVEVPGTFGMVAFAALLWLGGGGLGLRRFR